MLNSVIISGRLGREPRLANAGESNERANFSIAVDEGSGEQRKSTWLDVVVFGASASFITENVTVGQELHVKGRLTCRETAQVQGSDGKSYDRPVWTIVADSYQGVTFGRLPRGASEPTSNGQGGQQAATQAAAKAAEDEVPF